MTGNTSITNDIIQVIRDAGERHDEPEVASYYEALMRVIESHGDGATIYRGVPLSPRMLDNLAPWFRGMEHRQRLDPALLNAVGMLRQILARPSASEPSYAIVPAVDEIVLPDVVEEADAPLPDFARQAGWPQPPAQVVNTMVNIETFRDGVLNLGNGPVYTAPQAMDETDDDDPGLEPEPIAPGQPIDAMISYAHKDARWMRRIRDRMRAQGLVVWTDEGIPVGTSFWFRAIEDAISRAACVVLLMSPAAKKSDYVSKELACADLYRVPIVPVLCDGDARTATSFLVMGTQFTDVRSKRLMPGNNRRIQEIIQAVKEKRDARLRRLND